MPTMKATRVHAYGGAENLVLEEVERPVVGADEILVRVHAAGVNPVDWKIREGYLSEFLHLTLPFIPGYDLSGVVEEVGLEVRGFRPGDEVFAFLDLTRPRACAEYVAIKADEAALKPGSLSHAEAAAVPLAALTAWQCLFDLAGVRAGQKVLIHAAAGGVGHFAVQLARWAGAHVIGTASAANQEFIRRLGVHQAVDYRAVRFEEVTGKVDVVLDLMSGETRERSWPLLVENGILVTTLPPEPTPELLEKYQVRAATMLVQPSRSQLEEIAQLIDAGKLRPEVAAYPFAEVRQAQQLSQAGHTRGKLVLLLD